LVKKTEGILGVKLQIYQSNSNSTSDTAIPGATTTLELGRNSHSHILRETNLSSSLILPTSTLHGWHCDTACWNGCNVGDRQRVTRESTARGSGKLLFALVVVFFFLLLVTKVLR
jgi:hypothetical protein